MTQRSPMHARYQKDGTPKGQTRKSAASAKPSRTGTSSSTKRSSSGKSSGAKASARDRYIEMTPAYPEYKQLRRLWWWALGIATFSLLVSLSFSIKSVQAFVGDSALSIANGLSFGALGLIAFSWYIDLRKVRPLLERWKNLSAKEREAIRAQVADSQTDSTGSEQ